MARQTKPEFLDIINNYPWSNLQKQITGDVLRQFIVNILDSTAEMLLLDGRTIEEAITALVTAQNNFTAELNALKANDNLQDSKISALQIAITSLQAAVTVLQNASGGGTGEGNNFSDQFKIVDDVVYLNVDLITAESEDEGGGQISSDGIVGYGLNIDGWSESSYSILYNSNEESYNCEALSDWSYSGTTIRPFYIFAENSAALNTVNNETGDYLYISFDLSVNATFLSSNVSDIYVELIYPTTSSVGHVFIPIDMPNSSVTNYSIRRNMYYGINSITAVALSLYSSGGVLVPEGSVFEFSNIKIYRSDI